MHILLAVAICGVARADIFQVRTQLAAQIGSVERLYLLGQAASSFVNNESVK